MSIPQIKRIRQGDIDGVAPMRGCKPCAECGKSTREGKPYCSEHIEYLDFPRSVMDEVAAREEEIEHAMRGDWRKIDINGGNTQEVLMHLFTHGSRTVHRISRDVFIGASVRVAQAFADALEHAGLIEIGRTGRGSPVLSITGAGKKRLAARTRSIPIVIDA